MNYHFEKAIQKLGDGLSESQEDLSRRPFTVQFSIGPYRAYQLFNYRPSRADGPIAGGIAINHFRRVVIISPRATEAALCKAMLAVFHFEALQQMNADPHEDGDEHYIFLDSEMKLNFTGAGFSGYRRCELRSTMTPRIHKKQLSKVGAWFEGSDYSSSIHITPWATHAEIGRAIVDAIAFHDPAHRRWLNHLAFTERAAPRPKFFIPQNMGT